MNYDKQLKGLEITNLPDDYGTTTGYYFKDLYGTWNEVRRENGSKFYMI